MQRRKVLLPDPEGPIMTTTSPRSIVKSTPLRTSLRPNFLCTLSAMTMGLLADPTVGWEAVGSAGRSAGWSAGRSVGTAVMRFP